MLKEADKLIIYDGVQEYGLTEWVIENPSAFIGTCYRERFLKLRAEVVFFDELIKSFEGAGDD